MIYEVTASDGLDSHTKHIIFPTPSKNAALSCAETYMELAGFTTHVWIGLYLYAGFYTEDWFDIKEDE